MSSGLDAERVAVVVMYPHIMIPRARQFADCIAHFNPGNPCSNLMRRALLESPLYREVTKTLSSNLPRVTQLVSRRTWIHTQASCWASHWEEESCPRRGVNRVEEGGRR